MAGIKTVSKNVYNAHRKNVLYGMQWGFEMKLTKGITMEFTIECTKTNLMSAILHNVGVIEPVSFSLVERFVYQTVEEGDVIELL